MRGLLWCESTTSKSKRFVNRGFNAAINIGRCFTGVMQLTRIRVGGCLGKTKGIYTVKHGFIRSNLFVTEIICTSIYFGLLSVIRNLWWQRLANGSRSATCMMPTPLSIYWVGVGTISSLCLYDISVDFLTKGDGGENFCSWRQNVIIRGLAIPLSIAVGFTVGPIVAPLILLALL